MISKVSYSDLHVCIIYLCNTLVKIQHTHLWIWMSSLSKNVSTTYPD